MKRLLLIATCFILFLPATAAVQDVTAVENTQVPDIVQGIVADTTVNVFFTNGSATWEELPMNATHTYQFTLDPDGVITDVSTTAAPNASYEAKVDVALIREATRQSNTTAVLLDAYQDGRIAYRGIGTWNAALTTTTNAMTGATISLYNTVQTVTTWFS